MALAPNISYDNGFNTRFSLNLTYQFGITSDTFSSLRSNNRDIRVYDPYVCSDKEKALCHVVGPVHPFNR
ncbi:hypothetical protein OAW71_04660 [Methylophilaceae bacterium]|nr:hypothetical protein [Methylophilaceae bacterium]